MVIVITGIIGAIVAVFIRAPVEGYIDTVARAELTEAGDAALRRIARDVQAALPNSLRTTSPASTACFEFLPTVGGGRYRVAQTSAGAGNILDFTAADNAFDFLAYSGTGLAAGQQVVIYNLGITGADAYAGINRAAVGGVADSTITLSVDTQFPFRSPGNRFQVIPNTSVIYSCAAGTLWRSTRAINAAALAECPNAGTPLVTNVNCAASSFSYLPAASQRNGLLTMILVLTQPGARGNETIQLYQEVHVNNVP
ncbi:MAG: hypothetical protein QM739_11410 [Propionivibrio sp.]